MALQAISGLIPWPSPPYGAQGAANVGVTTIGAANEQLATIIVAPKAGDLHKIGFRTRAVATAGICAFRLEGVDQTTAPNEPNGTLLTANAEATGINLNANDTFFVGTLTADHTVARGDLVAVVCAGPASGTPDIDLATFSDDDSHDIPYSLHHNATSWDTSDRLPHCMQVEYSDGSYAYIPHLWPFEGLTALAFNSTDTNTHIGIRFRLPFSCKVGGMWAWIETVGDVSFQLFADTEDATGTPLEETTAADGPGDLGFGGEPAGSTKDQIKFIIFDTDVELTKDVWYRVVCKPETATDITMYGFGVTEGVAQMDSLNAGQDAYRTDWNSGGTPQWDNVTTARVFCGVLISHLDDGVSAGGQVANMIG